MNPGARAKILITDGDIKQKKLAESIGISEAKLSHYLNERYEMPTHVVVAIAEYFHVSADYLLGMTNAPERPMTMTDAEQKLVENFRTLNREQRELIVKNIAIMQEQNRRE